MSAASRVKIGGQATRRAARASEAREVGISWVEERIFGVRNANSEADNQFLGVRNAISEVQD